MKFLKFGFILSALTLFIFACAENKSTPPASQANMPVNTTIVNMNAPTDAKTDEISATKKIYTEKCVRCHKEDGTGGVTDIEGTKIKAPDLTTEKMKNEDDKEFIEVIENGAKEDGMPAFKSKLSDAEIKNLVKFIRSEFQK